jgi:signal transduction histidine kinase
VVALLRFACAAAVGAVIGAAMQTIAAAAAGVAVGALQAMMWALAMLLGALSTLPTLISWLVSHRFASSFPPLTRMQRVELAAVLLVQVAVVWAVFGSGAGAVAGNLRVPVLVLLGLVYATVRLPPRWNMALLGGSTLLVLWLVARGGNPLDIPDPTALVLWVQLSILVFQLVVVGLSVYIAQSRVVLRELAATQARYRSFIELSSEAVWRVELEEPMPVDLPQDAQIDWLRSNARVAEASASFGRIAGGGAGAQEGWLADLPWVQVFEANIEQLRQQDFCAGDLRFAAIAGGRVRTYLTSFSGVVREGRLERIWGVARDITEMFELNARLMREQELLRSYAQRIVGAEEGARRSTAAELHNGIGQELVAMGMLLTVLGGQLPPQHRVQIDEFRGRLHRVQQRTRDMISDLSPPGLYDLGLMPALQWLVVYLRGHDNLKVELDGTVDEAAVPTELRVLVFRLVREMLRNVAKHAGVDAAFVRISGDKHRLLVEVRDEGRGFDWHPDQLTNPKRGFGLWSIANRLREVGGQFEVASTPGGGTRLAIELPLARGAGASAFRSAS